MKEQQLLNSSIQETNEEQQLLNTYVQGTLVPWPVVSTLLKKPKPMCQRC